MTDEETSWQNEAIQQNRLLFDSLVRAEVAEAKLAKAVKALRKLITCVEDGCYCSEMQMATVMDEALEVLAELKETE